ncbi:MAG: peptidoglycan D,D-transpeptidase FtsI family protein [Planctomycetota bacterium]|jgi:penicillin-binding protein 2
MYDKRVKVFIAASLLLLGIGVLRLVQMQLLADSSLQDEILALKRQRGRSKQLRTLRGQILDRNGKVLATDTPQFQIAVDYQLSRFWDQRVIEAKELLAQESSDDTALDDLRAEVAARRADLERIMQDCAAFGVSREYVEGQINSINDEFWNLRTFLAWYRSGPDPNLVAKYNGRINSIPRSEARAAFERRFPDGIERTKLIARVDDIRDMYESRALLDLRTEDDIFAAQLEFIDINDVDIVPEGRREYPYGSVAAQTIGWVGGATQDRDLALFEHDRLASYLPGEVCGRGPGVEYACEPILRGRRGELVRDIDGKLVRSTETEFGKDVQLTLDIELQRQIEEYLTDPTLNPNADANMAAAVIEIRTGDILALVSLPTYDLNRVRYDYGKLSVDPSEPLRNRAINKQYPPGSSVKPVILVAGLEMGVITPGEVISCPAARAPRGWPDCLIYRRYGVGHDGRWTNNARNAIRGSCNIYFSHLADRLEPRDLQHWLYRFGYGHRLPLAFPHSDSTNSTPRGLRQASGLISSKRVASGTRIGSVDDLPPLTKRERPLFGIGQGNLRVTPLQAANSFATLARGGRSIAPRLVLEPEPTTPTLSAELVDLQISPLTLQTVCNGMDAVVNAPGGTAHDAFGPSNMAQYGVKVYGKTGSTEDPEHACFAGFAEDSEGAQIAVALIVEGGQSGSRDAAPLARDVIQFCIQRGYVGTAETSSFSLPEGSNPAAN